MGEVWGCGSGWRVFFACFGGVLAIGPRFLEDMCKDVMFTYVNLHVFLIYTFLGGSPICHGFPDVVHVFKCYAAWLRHRGSDPGVRSSYKRV